MQSNCPSVRVKNRQTDKLVMQWEFLNSKMPLFSKKRKSFTHEDKIGKISTNISMGRRDVKMNLKNIVIMRDHNFLRQEWFLSQQVRGYVQSGKPGCIVAGSHEKVIENCILNWEEEICLYACRNLLTCMWEIKTAIFETAGFRSCKFCNWKEVEITFSVKDWVIVFVHPEAKEIVSEVINKLFPYLCGYGNKVKSRLEVNVKTLYSFTYWEFKLQLPPLPEEKVL